VLYIILGSAQAATERRNVTLLSFYGRNVAMRPIA